ncbi:neuronal cell adhesion molecule-like [Ostrea edulis]|uniref:neuronal cell adhesion molecule-like n=1 Tax=Ostrea edulis TaxID=37623 RepID=UPI0024AFFF17|nr:neuronal cell adhesion molecule-like [Ostrea edulis]
MASRYLSAPQQNFTRLSIISVDLIRLVLEGILRSKIVPADLENAINSCSYLGNNLRPEQKALCCLPSPDYSTFDVSLLYTLIRNLCPVFKPTNRWGQPPSNSQLRIGDDIERLRVFRNEVHGHCESSSVSDTDFQSRWKEIETILLRVQKFMTSNGNKVDYMKELAQIADKDIGCEDMLKFRILLDAMIKLENEANVPKIVLRGAQSVSCGENASFEVDFESSSASWSVTWQILRGNITEQIDITREKYRGSNYERLVIKKVCKEDEGEYQAVLSRGASRQGLKRTSNSIFLEAAGDVPVLHRLEVSTGLEGITVHYKYEVRGNSPTVNHIAWTKNGDRIRIDNTKYIGGDLNDTYMIITSPTQDDVGQYTCTIANAVGEVSKSLSLDVPVAKIVTVETVYFGDGTKINSVITACPPLEADEYFGSNKDPNNPIMIFPKANFDDRLYYRLVIRNKIGEHVSNTVYLNVTGGPPNISNSHVTNIKKRSMTLTCEIFLYENSPQLQKILWMKDGTDIDIDGSGGKYSGGSINDPSLAISDVKETDKGSYQCKASNAVGSTLGDVIVLGIPDIDVEGPAKQQNDVQIFTAVVRSIPSPTKVHWRVKLEGKRDWTQIDLNSEDYRGTSNSLPQPKLVVKRKKLMENHSFQIKVTNFIGTNTNLIPDEDSDDEGDDQGDEDSDDEGDDQGDEDSDDEGDDQGGNIFAF